MKIKKEFIPLIQSGQKKYEIRKSNKFNDLNFQINNDIFKLKILKIGDFEKLINIHDPIFHECTSFFEKDVKIILGKFDIQSTLFLLDKDNPYLVADQTYYIYKWEKIPNFKISELEIIDKKE